MSSLFEPLELGPIHLKNRIVMAPLTRCRCDDDRRIPNKLMAKYYAQRSSAGLILTEATSISPMGVGYARTPGIWTTEQVEGWKGVVDEVHQKGGKIILQLWHVGRISDPLFLGGKLPVAPSALRPQGKIGRLDPNRDYVTPRALEVEEIKATIQDYKKAATNALVAGFDGVELHGANGYLIEQFLREGSNRRTDEYGGSMENRTRFLKELVDAILEVWEPGRIGVHLSPRVQSEDLFESRPEVLYGEVAKLLEHKKVGFIFTREHQQEEQITPVIRKNFSGVLIVNERYTFESGVVALSSGQADAVSYGIPYIANPDLVERFRAEAPLNVADPATFYSSGERGYTDYPSLS